MTRLARRSDASRAQRSIGERVKGIEPSYSAWEADVLPLNYTRRLFLNLLKALFRPYVHHFAVSSKTSS